MGYMRHHAIIVTSWNGPLLGAAHQVALNRFADSVSPILTSPINDYKTFLIGPDGSKEGWTESDQGDVRRTWYVDWLRAQAYGDGSSALEWVEVQYGDDDGDTRIVRHSDEDADQAEPLRTITAVPDRGVALLHGEPLRVEDGIGDDQ